jgi:hypothetical protein
MILSKDLLSHSFTNTSYNRASGFDFNFAFGQNIQHDQSHLSFQLLRPGPHKRGNHFRPGNIYIFEETGDEEIALACDAISLCGGFSQPLDIR